MWVILQWFHMTSCQKLDRLKRKAGMSHSSASSAHSKHAHGHKDRQEIQRPSPFSVYSPPVLLKMPLFFHHCSTGRMRSQECLKQSCKIVKPCNRQGLFQSLHTFYTHKAAWDFLSCFDHSQANKNENENTHPPCAYASVCVCICYTHRWKAAGTTGHKAVIKSWQQAVQSKGILETI